MGTPWSPTHIPPAEAAHGACSHGGWPHSRARELAGGSRHGGRKGMRLGEASGWRLLRRVRGPHTHLRHCGLFAACRLESAGRTTLLEVAHAEVARREARLQLCPERRVARRRRSRRRRGDRGEMRPPPAGRFFGRKRAITGDRAAAREQQQFGTQIEKAQFADTENRAKRPLVFSPTRLMPSLRLQRSAGLSCKAALASLEHERLKEN